MTNPEYANFESTKQALGFSNSLSKYANDPVVLIGFEKSDPQRHN